MTKERFDNCLLLHTSIEDCFHGKWWMKQQNPSTPCVGGGTSPPPRHGLTAIKYSLLFLLSLLSSLFFLFSLTSFCLYSLYLQGQSIRKCKLLKLFNESYSWVSQRWNNWTEVLSYKWNDGRQYACLPRDLPSRSFVLYGTRLEWDYWRNFNHGWGRVLEAPMIYELHL